MTFSFSLLIPVTSTSARTSHNTNIKSIVVILEFPLSLKSWKKILFSCGHWKEPEHFLPFLARCFLAADDIEELFRMAPLLFVFYSRGNAPKHPALTGSWFAMVLSCRSHLISHSIKRLSFPKITTMYTTVNLLVPFHIKITRKIPTIFFSDRKQKRNRLQDTIQGVLWDYVSPTR